MPSSQLSEAQTREVTLDSSWTLAKDELPKEGQWVLAIVAGYSKCPILCIFLDGNFQQCFLRKRKDSANHELTEIGPIAAWKPI